MLLLVSVIDWGGGCRGKLLLVVPLLLTEGPLWLVFGESNDSSRGHDGHRGEVALLGVRGWLPSLGRGICTSS